MFPQMMKQMLQRHGGKMLAGGYGSFVGSNLYNQNQVLSGQEEAPEGSRLEAISATKKFGPGSVGYGVHPSIRAIHAGLGNLGQAQIGSVFSRPDMQEHMAEPIGSESNSYVANNEHQYWKGTKEKPGGMNDWIGGAMGTAVSPAFREFIQQKMHDTREMASKYV